ncbi:hypothetical protein [Sphingopyxis sp.]|uniref:hypothetical protein n=1 Tax=Sphingopyxis sp. TaxID=1908224 RepID=UPI003D0FF4D1
MRWSPALPPRPGCPHRRLRRLLARTMAPTLTIGASTFRPWASANFVGARHVFPCAVAADDHDSARATLQAELTAAEWTLPGHIVADVAVEHSDDALTLKIEILTVED